MQRRILASLAGVMLVMGACGGGGGDDGGSGSGGSDDGSGSGADGGSTQASAADQALATRWYIWAAQEPEATSPLLDPDGAHCGLGQPTDVWFLAGSLGEKVNRACGIPTGRPIFAPLLNQVCSPDALCEFEDPELSAELDGEPLLTIEITNETFTLQGDALNPLTYAAEPVEVIASGHFVRIGALPAGEHTLHLLADDGGFVVDVTYALTVA